MQKELLLYGEQVCIDKKRQLVESSQSQVFEGYSLTE
jgi:hypothetical protein